MSRSSWRKVAFCLLAFAALLIAMAVDAGSRRVILVLGANGINARPVVNPRVWAVCAVIAAVCALGAGVTFVERDNARARLVGRVAFSLGVAGMLLGYLTWATQNSRVSLSNIIVAGIGGATPLLLGSTTGVLSERSGVINIAIEAEFLAGACCSALVATISHSVYLGLVSGIAGGMFVGMLLALLAVRYNVDQLVAGLILITLVSGITGYLVQQFLDPNAPTLNSPALFAPIGIPGLDRIPIIGKGLFDETIIFYLAVVIIVLVELMLSRTVMGLRIRACGEHPSAALSSGINVRHVRFAVVVVTGGIAGIGGTYFTLGSAGEFVAQMSAGLGYVSLAAVIFGGWRAGRAAMAALLFGFASSVATSLGLLNVNVNPELLIIAPYAVTIIALAGVVGGSARAPAADGQPLVEG